MSDTGPEDHSAPPGHAGRRGAADDGGAGGAWTRAQLGGPVPDVARRLLGSTVVGRGVALRVVEVEAYAPDDPASHTFRGRTPSNATMWGPPGRLYVYRSHGLHHCGNVTAGGGAAVLLRAAEVHAGRATALDRRGGRGADRARLLAGGPGRLGQVLDLDAARDDGLDLLAPDGQLRLRRQPPVPHERVVSGPRVGVPRAAEVPWRWWIDGSPAVSAYRRHPSARRDT